MRESEWKLDDHDIHWLDGWGESWWTRAIDGERSTFEGLRVNVNMEAGGFYAICDNCGAAVYDGERRFGTAEEAIDATDRAGFRVHVSSERGEQLCPMCRGRTEGAQEAHNAVKAHDAQ